MPFTQPPTANVIDLDSKQFLINFSIEATGQENYQETIIPGIGPVVGSAFQADLSSVNSPIRGSIPPVRMLQFSISAKSQYIGVPLSLANIYIFNSETKQVLSFWPDPPDYQRASVINGCVPFFVKSNQRIGIYLTNVSNINGVANDDVIYEMSFSCLTFNAPAYQAQSGWRTPQSLQVQGSATNYGLYPTTPLGSVSQVEIVALINPNPFPVTVVTQANEEKRAGSRSAKKSAGSRSKKRGK